jgi:hypothetical protein
MNRQYSGQKEKMTKRKSSNGRHRRNNAQKTKD